MLVFEGWSKYVLLLKKALPRAVLTVSSCMHATYDGDKRKDEQGGGMGACIHRLQYLHKNNWSFLGLVWLNLAYHMATVWRMQG